MNESNPIHFVTGKLAEHALREVVEALSTRYGFTYSIDVLPITVAALMTPKWLIRNLRIPEGSKRVILPGYLRSGIEEIRDALPKTLEIECGPKDLRDIPEMFGSSRTLGDDFGDHSIEIIAEINHVNRLSTEQILRQADRLTEDGADRIDLGCEPGVFWDQVDTVVTQLTSKGIRTSIDSFDPNEVKRATACGASLVLSVDEKNCHLAKDWDAEVVVIPSDLQNCEHSLQVAIARLEADGVHYRIDPILEPIGCGFTASLFRYMRVRELFPQSKMMMGIGNITELTDADSAAINLLLLGICEELRIGSVLTTQVIPWAQTAVAECAYGRQIVHYSIKHKIPPKRLSNQLVLLRDAQNRSYSSEVISKLASKIKDNNYRIFVAEGVIHLVSAGLHLNGTDPFAMMETLLKSDQGRRIDSSHAFYLGAEMQKALTALTLGKNYEQDESLDWGFLTRQEKHHRLSRKPNRSATELDGNS